MSLSFKHSSKSTAFWRALGPPLPCLGSFLLAFSFFFVFSSSFLRAQVVIEEDEGGTSSSDYWDKHFGFRFGATSARGLGSSDYRNYSFANLQWKHDFGWIAFSFEAEAYQRDYSYTLEVRSSRKQDLETELDIARSEMNEREANDIQAEIDGLRDEIVFTAGENDVFYREANVKLSPSDYLQVSLGYHTVVWGQVSGFSPVDYVMPLRFGSGNLTFSKTEGRLPQQAVIVSIFPIRQIEIQGYYFPELTLDPSLQSYFESDGRAEMEEEDGRIGYINRGFQYPKKSKESQYAGRLLFYFDWATIGFTYYKNWDQFFPDNNASVEPFSGENTMGRSDTYYRFTEEPRMAQVENYGFESSFPIGSWTLALDILRRKLPNNLDRNTLATYAHNANIFSGRSFGESGSYSEAAQALRRQLIDYAREENNGSLQYEVQETVIAVELSADLDTWVYGFGLVNINSQAADEVGNRLVKFEEDLEELYDDEGDDSELNTAPFINIGRYLSEDKKDIVGLSLGFLGGLGFGAVIYFGQEYFESLQVGLALEVIQLFSSSEAEEAIDGYELENEIYPALRWVFSYKF